jgi:hypothetical protein
MLLPSFYCAGVVLVTHDLAHHIQLALTELSCIATVAGLASVGHSVGCCHHCFRHIFQCTSVPLLLLPVLLLPLLPPLLLLLLLSPQVHCATVAAVSCLSTQSLGSARGLLPMLPAAELRLRPQQLDPANAGGVPRNPLHHRPTHLL